MKKCELIEALTNVASHPSILVSIPLKKFTHIFEPESVDDIVTEMYAPLPDIQPLTDFYEKEK